MASDAAKRPLEEPDLAHTVLEDALALFTGTLFVALGLVFMKTVGLATGGTAGLAFLVHYGTGWPLGAVFFAVNVPFYAFAFRVFGLAYTVKTFAAVALLSLEAEILPHLFRVSDIHPAFAAVAGGMLAGVGLLILIRHKSSLGGVGVLAVWLQERYGVRAGTVQMGIDAVIVLGAFAVLPPVAVLLSVAGAVALNLVLAVNHRRGRYQGF
ncbi:YitT family protein [Chthonobacter rhizosphaerae]|uniref:YitT family protein n=1 Tax=Chthonobacter rhizosphaerae TaxID=2735553 RepID=UPI0015EEEC18|nr:YitT family protein [Chthonobacter rhizosphaerae]